MKELRKKLWMGLIQMILSAFLLMNIGMLYLQYTKGEDALEEMPYAILEVTGASMEPVLSPGDGVFVWQSPFEKIEIGDMIVFVDQGELITHQVVELEDGYVIARGTANEMADKPVTKEDYRARVVFPIPNLWLILTFYDSAAGFILFSVLLFLIIFGKDIFSALYEANEARSVGSNGRNKKCE